MIGRRRIRVRGTVQGVGFRPFVYREANALGVSGFVRNDAAGVLIEIEGPDEALQEFESRLRERTPPMAQVCDTRVTTLTPEGRDAGFAIVGTDSGGPPTTPVSVDMATCTPCLVELADPENRRHRYPFINCTDCGPRYTIVQSVPYDRSSTTMSGFTMCTSCQQEYDDPSDRRFHAQPNACPGCGPSLSYHHLDGHDPVRGPDALAEAVAALIRGAVVAVKGIGGFHLAVDASNEAAVSLLRRRKARDDKPFAVMVAGAEQARDLCHWTAGAERALLSPQRPIVLAPRRADARVARGVAPGLSDLGVIVAYTPLHHILLADVGRPLVMTSGNISDEPIVHEDEEALVRLGPLADGVLGHDRAIHIRCDDSVARALPDGSLQLLRRSRGFSPAPIALVAPGKRSVLAVGAELKCTVSVTVGGSVVTSHHLGDLEHHATYQAFQQAISHLCELHDARPEIVAHDMHPEYLSTKLAVQLDLPTEPVQHHHAHIAACMVEHGRTDPVLGVVFDGAGMGTDGTLWGGELLVADLAGFQRVAHLRTVGLPGGAAAMREPWRMAMTWLDAAEGPDAALAFGEPRHEHAEAVLSLAHARATLRTSSVGRLFDATASLLGIRDVATYEGQAAIELESAAWHADARTAAVHPMTTSVEDGATVLDPRPLVSGMVRDLERGAAVGDIAAGFHLSLGTSVAELASAQASAAGIDTAVLTGGVFQNALLTRVVVEALRARGMQVLTHHRVPGNDGGISVGQAAVACFRDSTTG